MHRTRVLFLLLASAAAAFSQTLSSNLDGTVKDSQGALVPKAEVTVTNSQTTQVFRTLTDDKGHWVIVSLPTGTYSVSVSSPGFKKAAASDVKMDAGIPATVNLTMEVGTITETVEVSSGAEVLETASATVTTNLTAEQVRDLPIPSRNATDLLMAQPGSNTPAGPRNTTFNGLPQSTINMTMDGVNIQDNLLKNSSGGALYPAVYPRLDAVEEVSVTSFAAGAESLGEGAVQIKFVTKSGTNNWHGGIFDQERNTYFNANYYFNSINQLPRDRLLLHQLGAHAGGPIVKNKMFIFFNYEVFRFPATLDSGQLPILAPSAQNGIYTYKGTDSQLHQVNLYSLAKSAGFPATADPIMANTFSQIAKLTGPGTPGSLTDNIASNDYNRLNYRWFPKGTHKIDFPQGKLDYVINSKHHWEATGGVNPYRLVPDIINGVLPVFPGTGTVLGSPTVVGQREAFWTGSTALRSAWSSHWTSEIRFGMSAGNVIFSEAIQPPLFAPWRGYAPNLGFGLQNPYRRTTSSRRNDPVQQLLGNASRTHGSHLVNLGGSFSRISLYQQSFSTQTIPTISFGVAANDPVGTGATNIFTAANFPNSQQADLSNAAALYAALTGRVSSITSTAVLDEKTHQYGPYGAVDRLRQLEFGLYVQDSLKVTPRLTLNYGLRFENQNPFQTLSGTYTRPGYAGLYGISGVGDLFQPGASSGSVPVYNVVPNGDIQGYPPTRFWAPTVGAAWVLPRAQGPLGWLVGKEGQSVLRAGVSVAPTRGDFTGITGVWGSNQGRTITTNVSPGINPQFFGAPGSVLFSNPTLPSLPFAATPTYPLPVNAGNSVNDFDPNLKSRYVMSWNLGFQRSLTQDTVLEVRYVGNRSARLWSTLNLNEVNIVENGFLDQFQTAQSNLAIARQQNPNSVNFGNQGLPGQKDIPIVTTGLGLSSDTNTANLLVRGQAGDLANTIANTAADMTRLKNAGYPANLFVVNPTTGGGGANLTTNLGGTTYNALQVEVRRRFSKGVLIGASYTWAHALSYDNILSLHGLSNGLYEAPSAFDIRHAIKLNWIYELPFGSNHQLLGSVHNPIVRTAVSGWQFSGVSRIQSGTPSQLLGGRGTFVPGDNGVVLHNLTTSQLQSMISIRKTSNFTASGVPYGLVYDLPQSLIDNTLAAFQLNGKALDPNAPYIGPASTAGQYGDQVFLYGPWLPRFDLSLVKHTRVGEKKDIEFRANALNAFNLTNFFLVPNGAGNINVNSLLFGQTTNAYRDYNSTNDTGARMIEFGLRFSF